MFGAGVVVGLMIAPWPVAALRAKLRELAGWGAAALRSPSSATKCASSSSHSPRTWHLPQPEVDVQDGRVVLSGSVPHATAAADLERTATGVPA